jgi:Fe-S-cluster containining protein
MTESNISSTGKVANPIKYNCKIAYRGQLGHLRELYCIEQLRYMKACYKKIGEGQLEHVLAHGKTISCGKGCDACCRYLYIGATLQECEAIAYFLQHNWALLESFITRYPRWRESVREKGDQFIECQRLFTDMLVNGSNKPKEEAFDESVKRHNHQNILCPFLENSLCIIYETRPANCAGFFATSPPELCQPVEDEVPSLKPEFTLTAIEDVLNDTSFYYKRLDHPITLYAPVAVYQILTEGYSYLNQFAGLEGIKKEAYNDPEVSAIIRSNSGR